MRIVIAGAHGQIARRLGRLLSARGDTVVGIIRNPAHESDVVGDGVEPVVLDLETASVEEVAAVRPGADAVVFAAGAGPGSGTARKDTVDRGAAVLLADAAERAGVRALPAGLVHGRGRRRRRRDPGGHGRGLRRLPAAKLRRRAGPPGPRPAWRRRSCGPAASPTTRARGG